MHHNSVCPYLANLMLATLTSTEAWTGSVLTCLCVSMCACVRARSCLCLYTCVYMCEKEIMSGYASVCMRGLCFFVRVRVHVGGVCLCTHT